MGKFRLFFLSAVICTVLALVALALIGPKVMNAQDQALPKQDQVPEQDQATSMTSALIQRSQGTIRGVLQPPSSDEACSTTAGDYAWCRTIH